MKGSTNASGSKLSPASRTELGGVIVGTHLSIDSDGVVDINNYNTTSGIGVRGTGLVSAEASPSNNGEINWVYE